MEMQFNNIIWNLEAQEELTNSIKEFSERLSEEKLAFSSLDFMDELISEIEEKLPRITQYKHMILLGVGGSALGTKVLQASFTPPHMPQSPYSRKLWVADKFNEGYLQQCFNILNPEETLILAVSKSGSTLETIAQYHICKHWLQEMLPTTWHEHLVVISDAERGFLRREAEQYKYTSFSIPASLGGRFSVFSSASMVPAAFLGIDYVAFLQGAKKAKEEFFAEIENYLQSYQAHIEDNQKKLMAVPKLFLMADFAKNAMNAGFSQLILFNYIVKWASLGEWFRQLWSESLGKNGLGSTPISAVGTTDQHSILQLFLDGPKDKACIFLQEQQKAHGKKILFIPENISEEWDFISGKSLQDVFDAETNATRQSLINANLPLLSIEMENNSESYLGSMMWNLGMTTILTAYFLNINPLDQPAVEEGKILAKKSLSQS